MRCPDCKQLRHEGPCQTETIECRKCGDTVDMPKGKRVCWQCIEESAPQPQYE
jgi:hypothetical protein